MVSNESNIINNRDDKLIDEITISIKECTCPTISIGIVTYNRSERLIKCLSSIFSQIENDLDFEIIVSDNNSTDNTENSVKTFTDKYTNLKYYKNEENIGFEKNLLNVVSKCNGKYIFPHGDDDYFKPDTLYKILAFIKNNQDCSLIYLNILNDYNNIERINSMEDFLLKSTIYSTFISALLLRNIEFSQIDNLNYAFGTNIPQLYWAYKVLETNPNALFINMSIYMQEKDQSPGGYSYSFAETMIEGYFLILEYFVGRGLPADIITYEKKRLALRNLWYFELGLKSKDKKFLKNFENIFYKYYHNEEYFLLIWDELVKIKEKYDILGE